MTSKRQGIAKSLNLSLVPELEADSDENMIPPYDLDSYNELLSNLDDADETAIDQTMVDKATHFETSLQLPTIVTSIPAVKAVPLSTNQSLTTSKEQEERDLSILTRRLATDSPLYGLPPDTLTAQSLSDSSGGILFQAKVYRDNFSVPKLSMIDKSGKLTLKARRPIPVVYESDFFNSLHYDKGTTAFVFQGRLNGWPALNNLEVVSLDYWYEKKVGPKTVAISRNFWTNKGNKNLDNEKEIDKAKPRYPKPGYVFFTKKPLSIRVTLRAPKYTETGYEKDNKGFVFWYQAIGREAKDTRVIFGEEMIQAVEADAVEKKQLVPKAIRAHFYGHRYFKEKESARDKLLYHTGVLIEWDHGLGCTNCELAYLYGLGGYNGRSNWLLDRDAEAKPDLYHKFPDAVKAPWVSTRNEIRMIDMPFVRNAKDFLDFLNERKDRFIKPSIKYSSPIRLSFNSASHLTRYLLNYSLRDTSYSEDAHNCQSFAADFYSFLCAKKDVEPFYPVKLLYVERRHLFLYEASLFETKQEKLTKNKGKKEKNKTMFEKIEKDNNSNVKLLDNMKNFFTGN